MLDFVPAFTFVCGAESVLIGSGAWYIPDMLSLIFYLALVVYFTDVSYFANLSVKIE
jgi:hypothetical protein